MVKFQFSLEAVLLLWVTTSSALKNIFELKLDCPHSPMAIDTTISGSIILPAVPLEKLNELEIESSCSMEIHNSVKSKQSYTKMVWAKKADHTGKATSSSYEGTSSEIQLGGTCVIGSRVIENASKLRKAVLCYDLICNQTACQPELHFLSPFQACNLMRSCIVAVGQFRIQITFSKTFCVTGILTEGRCFQPDKNLWSNVKPGVLEMASLNVLCFFTAKKDEEHKIVEKIEKAGDPKCNTSSHKLRGYYTCVAGGNSDIMRVPNDNDIRSQAILRKMFISPYGEDHDRVQDDISHQRIAGELEFKIPSTSSENNLKTIAFSGSPLYSSLYVFSKDEDPKYALGAGILANLNHSECDKKAFPLIWNGIIDLPGTYEEVHYCRVFCVLSGPGAACEAYSEGGIFNISSPTCLVSKQTTYRQTDQQINFICQRVDIDLVIYCNGQMKVIKTQTLVIGQCIYSITSFFSLLPSVAHSIAVELCVPGFHGWATAALLITFCFGWILIPTCTWCILIMLKFLMSIIQTQSQESRFKVILRKIKEEYERTKGSMVCDICKLECDTARELKAHNLSCPQGQCPYCLVSCELSEAAYQAHFKVCQVTHRFQEDLKKSINQKAQVGFYRTINVFRYKSRCYILIVWLFLLTLETIIWAVSAEPQLLTPEWNDNVHGVASVPMHTDLEVDFSLLSSSNYVYKRVLKSPRNDIQEVHLQIDIQSQSISAEVQSLGHWFDARMNIKTSFHCYGSCVKYKYPWHTATCTYEFDFEYENNWACNPPDCPGIGTGCTACGVYLDHLKAVGTAYRIVNIQYYRRVCVQLGTEHYCKDIGTNDCFITKHIKVCLIGTVSKFQPGDTLLFLGPMEGGGLVLKQWCTTTCQFVDPGDIMKQDAMDFSCPDYPGSFRKKCSFATLPVCQYEGNTVSGYKKLMATRDSFQSFNTSIIHYTKNRLEWKDPDGLLKDHINILISRDLEYEDLSDNPCKVSVTTTGIDGSWGSGVGFNLKCQVSLTECQQFLTSIKACDMALCYGAKSVTLTRGNNDLIITGKGGHSGSRFKCCHLSDCSKKGFTASAPHVDRVMGIDFISTNQVYDDGAGKCGVRCWFIKTGEWVSGLFRGNWMVIIVLICLTLASMVMLSIFCPIRKRKKN
ncbi:glycoprotein precursor [Academ virus]|nr:glycoprotein precursor [Academ virus]